MRNSLFDMKEMGGGEKSTSMHKMYSLMLKKVPVIIKKMSRFIDNELFWFAVCTLSVYLWVILKIRNHFWQ